MPAEAIRSREDPSAPIALHAYDELVGPVYVRLAYYYAKAPDPAVLRESLAKVLALYPVLGGRMRVGADGRWEVHFPEGSGATFEVVDRRGPGPATSEPALRDARPFLPAQPLRLLAPSTPLLAVRLTRFADGSGVVGLARSHALVDGHAGSQFALDWSKLARGMDATSPAAIAHDRRALDRLGDALANVPVERTQYRRLGALGFARAQAELVVGVVRAKTELFRISRAGLEELQGRARASASGYVSSMDAVSAGLLRVIGPSRATDSLPFSVIVDVRKQLADRLPRGLYANLCSSATGSIRRDELRGAPLGVLAGAVRSAIAAVGVDSVTRDLAFLREHRRAPVGRLWPHSIDLLRRGGLMFDSWSRSTMFDVDFGTGRPHWVELSPMLPDGLMLFLPTPEGDGSVMLRASLAGAPRELLRGIGAGESASVRGERLVERMLAAD